MIVGIVGAEGAKFTPLGEARAKLILTGIISNSDVTEVVSGKCHLGGIDIWAVQAARNLGRMTTEFPPKHLSWEWYKQRNLQIAQRSHVVHCIAVDVLPQEFKGMKFELCYHCGTKDHVKSGGCWTMKQAIKMGKVGRLHIVNNY